MATALPASGRRRRTVPSRFARIWSSPPTGGTRRCAMRLGCTCPTSARRWTCCGCGCRVATGSGADARPHGCRPDLRHARSRRLLAVRLCHPEGRHRRCARARASPHSGTRSRALAPYLRDRVARAGDLGRRQAADRRGEPAGTGIGRACCASATRRTPCRRSAGWASTWRSRTRLPPPTYWFRDCAPARRRSTICARCSAGASGRHA